MSITETPRHISHTHRQRIIDVNKLLKPSRRHYDQDLAAFEAGEKHGEIIFPPLVSPVEAAREANAFIEEAFESIGKTEKQIRELREKRIRERRKEAMDTAGREIANSVKAVQK
jgi:hypothetical protein